MPTHSELDWNVNPGPRRKVAGDINSPGYAPETKKQEPGSAPKTGLESTTGIPPETPPEPEVRILSAEWKPGHKGFQYNEPCYIDVKAEYFTKTIRARLLGNLWGIYNGEEYDLLQEVEGFIDKETGVARMELKHLWFVDEHYRAWQDDKSTPCQYLIKNISHSRGENTIDSPVLDMPKEQLSIVRFRIELDPENETLEDDVFTLLSTDPEQRYRLELTVKDDKIPGDKYLDLEFVDLIPDLDYSLLVNPGAQGNEYFILENASYEELVYVA